MIGAVATVVGAADAESLPTIGASVDQHCSVTDMDNGIKQLSYGAEVEVSSGSYVTVAIASA